MGMMNAGGVRRVGRTPSGGDRRAIVEPADHVSVFVCRCVECGRLALDGPSWNDPADVPAELPRCRCGGRQETERVDVNDALPRLP